MNNLRRILLDNRVVFLLLQILVLSIFIWAVGGISYFFLSIFQTLSNNNYSPSLILPMIASVSSSVLIVMIISLTIHLADRYKLKKWLVYLIIVVMVLPADRVATIFTYVGVSRFFPQAVIVRPQSPVARYVYLVNPPLIAILYFYLMTRERKRTRKITEQEYELLQLKSLKTRAELDALQAKINPHFLYNSLNSIASLVHIDPDRAERMVLLLSRFFRYSTGTQNQYTCAVAEEMDMVQTYLEVEKVRFEERLNYSVVYEKPLLEQRRIPRFLVQPLVENAIKHGISKNAGEGRVEIRIGSDDENLFLIIHDNGVPFSANMNTGYGLQSIQDKLRLLCSEKARLEIHNGAYKHIKIIIPLSMTLSEPDHV